jgi:DNA primase
VLDVPKDFTETIDTIRQRVNIVDVITQHLALKKAGKNYRALCPFHQEKTPSFMVSDEKQIFHCFGCGAGGDVFTFLMRYENLTFYESLTELAKRVGITIPRGGDRTEDEKKRDLFFHINQTAADFFHASLLSQKTGSPARGYLEKRAIRRETIEQYRLGYAPPGWTNLASHLKEKSIDLKMAQTLGLILPRKQQGWYDQFRNRVIFPIENTSGRIVGFGGGAIDEAMPKYLNSTESAIYKKSQSIYGIQIANSEMRQRDLVLVVEGYFDLLTLHQSGFRNAVAPLGTALTQDQVRIMKRYSRNFVILFDPDEAGIKATFRALDSFMAEEIHPKTTMLPAGHDPDSFVREEGPEALEKAIESAVPVVDAFIEHTVKQGDLKTVAGKVQIGRTILPVLKKIRDPIERRLYARSVSERLGVKEQDLFPLSREDRGARPKANQRQARSEPQGPFPASEEALVELMLNHPRFIPVVFEQGVIEEFESEDLRQIAGILKDLFQRKGEAPAAQVLSRVTGEDLKSRVSRWAVSKKFQEEDLHRAVKDCIREVKRGRLKRDQDVITREIREAERTHQTGRVKELLQKKLHLIERERSLQERQTI